MLNFIKKPIGQIVIFLSLSGLMGGIFFYEKMTQSEMQEGMDVVLAEEGEYDLIEIQRSNLPYIKRGEGYSVGGQSHQRRPLSEVKQASKKQSKQPIDKEAPEETQQTRDRSVVSRKLRESMGDKPKDERKALPLELFSSSTSLEKEVSLDYAPYGRMIPCETVITIDSSRRDTPIVGFVTEDVYHNGRLIIPAGVEVHGRASPNKFRERIDASGSWVLVWRDQSHLNGSEMTISGVALDMSRDYVNGQWSEEDGSAGLKGNLIKSDQWTEVKLYAATFLSAVSQGVQEKKTVGSAFGETERVPTNSLENAALQGNTAVIDRYADQILKEIQEHGFYVRVPAGTQFYLYVTQALDLEDAKVGNEEIKEVWKKEEKYEETS